MESRVMLLAAILVAGMVSATAHAGGHGEKILFSDPGGSVATSNLTSSLNSGLERMNPTPSGFKQAQEDLLRPMANSFKPQDSMQGVMSLPNPQSQPAPDKHTREMMDRRRNWAFTDLSDLYPEPTMDQMLGLKEYGADGKEKKAMTAMEKYYEKLGRKPDQKTDQNGRYNNNYDGKVDGSFSTKDSLNPVISALPDSEAFSRGIFSSSHEGASEKNLNAFEASEASADAVAEALTAQKRTDDFKRLLDPSLPGPKLPHVAGSGIDLVDFTHQPSLQTSSDPLNAAAKQAAEPHRSILNPSLGLIDPTTTALRSHVYDDPTASALGMPNPFKITTPPKPPETVKQMLDPFSAGLMKSKF